MEQNNPYAAPRARVADVPDPGQDHERLKRIASGQRIIIYSLLGSFFAYAMQLMVSSVAVVLTLAAFIVSIVGAVRLAGALGRGVVWQVVYAILMVIPLINLLAMLALSSQATRALRKGGYRVGFLGARPPKA
ncbi:MAG: hypothetical protein IT482_14195 [Gammaproteobacteria bacterium]|jgi:uncharacterized membrane protein|nr:hypothetical protein [Gammaproteobacteria bacterium]